MDEAFWIAVRKNGYALPEGSDLPALTAQLGGWLGSVDPVLRDEIAYATLATWVSEGRYGADALRELGRQMSRNLEVGLGERGTDSVFLRTFSVLILGEVVAADAKHPRLPAALLDAWRGQTLRYLGAERDERGFVPGRGWAHAAAHAADCLGAFGSHPRTTAEGLQDILHAVADRLLRPGAKVFINEEDERLAYACLAVLRRPEVSHAHIVTWCERFSHPQAGGTWRAATSENEGARTYLNVKTFLRSLYLQLRWCADPPRLRDALEQCILATLRAIGTGLYGQ
ncbi:MAG: DUF2785 domain-containing protein [Thermaerobacter sp.]|nr:DUF2785 domain-containing protein [Thermaerobacter sp.]